MKAKLRRWNGPKCGLAFQPDRRVDRQREAVHFGEQRHEEGAERTERTLVALGLRSAEAVCEEDKEGGIDDHEGPQSI